MRRRVLFVVALVLAVSSGVPAVARTPNQPRTSGEGRPGGLNVSGGGVVGYVGGSGSISGNVRGPGGGGGGRAVTGAPKKASPTALEDGHVAKKTVPVAGDMSPATPVSDTGPAPYTWVLAAGVAAALLVIFRRVRSAA